VPERFEFQVTAKDYKKRLDEFLFYAFPHLSRMYLRELIRDGKCEVNGRWENRGYLLKQNDFIEIEVDCDRQTSLRPEPIPLEIVFEDNEIMVVNKPAGMLVHPTVGVRQGTLLNALAYHLNFANSEAEAFKRAGLIHRLDKETSGLILISKNSRAHRILCSHFKRRLVEKRYLALVEGQVNEDCGKIDAPIGKYEDERLWNIKPDGKESLTNFWVRKRLKDKTLLEVEPVTGRTNQLRIHLAHIGHPILGDKKYGGREFPRLCLHAFKLIFWHPNGNYRLKIESEIPEEMADDGEIFA
jgi:23S rRNA pseudouridine1911/1915/1917 synthase